MEEVKEKVRVVEVQRCNSLIRRLEIKIRISRAWFQLPQLSWTLTQLSFYPKNKFFFFDSMYTKKRTHLLESVDVGSNQSKMDPQWLSQRGFWGFSDDTMAKYRWNHRFGQWLRCFRETFTLWELGLGIASHTRKRECECLGVWFQMLSFRVWFQMLSFSVWVWAGAAVTMDWRRGREGLKERQRVAVAHGRERERKKKLILWKFTQTYQK